MTRLQASTLSSASAATQVPGYDRAAVNIGIVHFGVGGFHRAHQAVYLDDLLALDPAAKSFGLCGVNLLPNDRRIVDVLSAQDTLYTVLERHGDGTTSARIVGSIVEHRYAPDHREAVLDLLSRPTTAIVTLTITEGGYFYSPGTDSINVDADDLRHDAEHLDEPRTAFGYIVAALRRRRAAGVAPFTVLSCDNIHGNGDIARRVVTAFAGRIDTDLGRWVEDNVMFPNSMVDRITPRTTAEDTALAEQLTGLADGWPVSTEPFTQWVIEDRFSAGRPAWEKVGAELVDDVRPYELMKMRLLNAGHQTVGYVGRLLDHTYVHDACADPTVGALLSHFQHREAALTLAPIPGTDFDSYAAAVADRFRNAQIRDLIERLTDESSTMVPNYVLPVIRDLIQERRDATAAIAVVVCWARFCEGRTDNGTTYLINDRRADDLQTRAARQGDDPLAMIRDNALFAGLNDQDAFTGPYRRIMTAMQARGVRPVLDELFSTTRTAV